MKLEYDGDFRRRWDKRRDLAVSVIRDALAGDCVEWELDRLKAASNYERLSSQDRASFRRFCSDVRTIWEGWHALQSHERTAFLNGKSVYSTLAKEIRERVA
jgi:hypothetical protein